MLGMNPLAHLTIAQITRRAHQYAGAESRQESRPQSDTTFSRKEGFSPIFHQAIERSAPVTAQTTTLRCTETRRELGCHLAKPMVA